MLQATDRGHDEGAYMFGILMVEYNKSPVDVEEAIVHVDKFITPSVADSVIRRLIRLVRYDPILTLIRYEELRWGHEFFHPVQDLPQCLSPGCQALIYWNTWKSERWITSCSRTCWWRQVHQMLVAKFNSGDMNIRFISIFI
jgi:hypothetical protein